MSVELKAALNDVEFKRAVLRSCLATTGHGDHKCFVTDIHPHDQMLQHSLQEHTDAHAAISQYFSVGAQQFNTFSQIAGLLFQDRERVKVLDFACGFGRLTRFLVLDRSRFRITGAEIQQEALDFVAKRFAVQCLNSCPDPSAFNCNDSFDIIWVASLFSHLPEGLFHQWLRVLFSLLRPGGVLAFSTKPLATAATVKARSEPGFVYTTESECRQLDSRIYGTACVDDAFVRDAIERVTGPGHPVFHMPRALANEQDLHLVPCNRDHDLSILKNVRKGVTGWLDRCSLVAGELCLEGWAASLDEGPAQTIEIVVDGRRHSVFPEISRPDVAEAFADERLQRSGWKFRETLTADPQELRLHVSAQSAGGSHAMIYFGCVHRESQ